MPGGFFSDGLFQCACSHSKTFPLFKSFLWVGPRDRKSCIPCSMHVCCTCLYSTLPINEKKTFATQRERKIKRPLRRFNLWLLAWPSLQDIYVTAFTLRKCSSISLVILFFVAASPDSNIINTISRFPNLYGLVSHATSTISDKCSGSRQITKI